VGESSELYKIDMREKLPEDPSLCTCACHDPHGWDTHFDPCCNNCKFCGKGIKFGEMKSHLEVCLEKPEEDEEE
ncbi:hypothetical protein, partial [Klebsiella pneumoniae]|uniref:hypothetical protein n=1 Tax=Klebsiella pneumoniae TaxID=573 RepID=UPI003851A1FD